jgi:hypothetical protein
VAAENLEGFKKTRRLTDGRESPRLLFKATKLRWSTVDISNLTLQSAVEQAGWISNLDDPPFPASTYSNTWVFTITQP